MIWPIRHSRRSEPQDPGGLQDAQDAAQRALQDRRETEALWAPVREVVGRMRQARERNHFEEAVRKALEGGRP